ncbi:MAG: NADH-quinone oxidoreductase subunit C [Methanoregulaceae archaeon]|nr:NADH-quinone oxidoreductase subunit C [Methanoregulaceae archaeon]
MTGPLNEEQVREVLGGIGTVNPLRSARITVNTNPSHLREAIDHSRTKLMCERLITISAVDNGHTIELVYHFTGPHRTVLSLMIELPRDRPEAPTISDVAPPAGIYERQIHDLMGVVFTGHPDLRRIILNEDWPEAEYPLRKDWKPDPNTFYGGICEEKK